VGVGGSLDSACLLWLGLDFVLLLVVGCLFLSDLIDLGPRVVYSLDELITQSVY
jgi:hypothetical protein